MYHWVTDKEFLKRAYSECADVVNQFVQNLKNYNIEAKMNVVGSKSRNMVTQNESEPIDFDFNVTIISAPDINDCREIKKKAIQAFNDVLYDVWGDCHDSTSALTTNKIHFTKGNRTEFSMDICLVRELNGSWYRLIHEKTGFINCDSYRWEQARNTAGIDTKVAKIKSVGVWMNVRETYLKKKNMYLRANDYNHSSFICYIEAVNEVYKQVFGY